jgi:hypothetical protein
MMPPILALSYQSHLCALSNSTTGGRAEIWGKLQRILIPALCEKVLMDTT